jgi:hypothetical protein
VNPLATLDSLSFGTLADNIRDGITYEEACETLWNAWDDLAEDERRPEAFTAARSAVRTYYAILS